MKKVSYTFQTKNGVRPFPMRLQNLLLINRQPKMQIEAFRLLSAENHAIHKNFKIIHHCTDFCINLQVQLNMAVLYYCSSDFLSNSDSVMNIKGCKILI